MKTTSEPSACKKLPNRWVVLAAAAFCNSLAGVIYIWSIFNEPLIATHGWSIPATTFAYSLYLISDFVSSFMAGLLQTKVRVKTLILLGGVCLGAGWALSGVASTIPLFYLTFGFLAGFGSGFIYNLTVSTATRWFPDKRGLANGIVLACTGLAPLALAPLGNFLIENLSLSTSFFACGIIFLSVTLLCFSFFETPPQDWAPSGYQETLEKDSTNDRNLIQNEQEHSASALSRLLFALRWSLSRHNLLIVDTDLKGAVRQPLFYLLWLLLVFSSSAGMMAISHASGIGQELAHLNASQGALQVGLMAICSCLGRIGFGALSDRIGRFPTMNLILLITAIDLFFFFGKSYDFVSFSAALGVVGLGFGGVMTTIPTICADFFGSNRFGQNYALLYSGYTASSIVGPMIAANVLASTGSYQLAFPLAGALALAGLITSLAITTVLKRRKTH